MSARRRSIRRPGNRRDQGLTLIEVLIAVVVLTAGIVVVASGLTTALRAESWAEDEARAATVAGAILARMEAGELPIEETSGDVASDFPDDVPWQRYDLDADTQERTPVTGDLLYEITMATTDLEDFEEVTVTIAWTDGPTQRTLSVVRLFNVWEEADAAAAEEETP